MTQDEVKRRSMRAKAFMASDAYKEVMADFRERQVDVFLNSGPTQLEDREDAHAMVRALNLFEQILQADVDAGKMIDRKEERDRG